MTPGAIIITKNEGHNILACINSLSFCSQVIVVDSGSIDGTAKIAAEAGAMVFVSEFKDYASQKNFALKKATAPWVLSVDADERVSPELGQEIIQRIHEAPSNVCGYSVPRRNVIFGRWLRYGACRGDRPIRLLRAHKAFFNGIVHETAIIEGKTERLKSPLWHYSTPTVKKHVEKINRYSSLEAVRSLHKKAKRSGIHFFIRPFGSFVTQFFFRIGVADGREGFLFACLSAYHEFVSLAKRWELESIPGGVA